MYDYALGGKDSFSADCSASDAVRSALPTALLAVKANRKFMRRAVRYMLSAGVRQFLDVGCGLPGRGNTHDIAQAVDPAVARLLGDLEPVEPGMVLAPEWRPDRPQRAPTGWLVPGMGRKA